MNARQRSLNAGKLLAPISDIPPYLITFLTNVSDLAVLKYSKDKNN